MFIHCIGSLLVPKGSVLLLFSFPLRISFNLKQTTKTKNSSEGVLILDTHRRSAIIYIAL